MLDVGGTLLDHSLDDDQQEQPTGPEQVDQSEIATSTRVDLVVERSNQETQVGGGPEQIEAKAGQPTHVQRSVHSEVGQVLQENGELAEDPSKMRYKEMYRIGKGGQGSIFRVETLDGKVRALKLMNSSTPKHARRMLLEARTQEVVGRLSPGVPKVYRTQTYSENSEFIQHLQELNSLISDDEEGIAVEMELIEGDSLEDLVSTHFAMLGKLRRRGKREMTPAAVLQALTWFPMVKVNPHEVSHITNAAELAEFVHKKFQQAMLEAIIHIAETVATMHEAGFIHRDVKPGNVMIDKKTGAASLLDFGLVKVIDDADVAIHGGKEVNPEDIEDLELPGTRTGALVGTPNVMSPEAFSGQTTTAVDVWALATTLVRCLTGEYPFERGNISDLIVQVRKRDISDEVLAKLDPKLVVIIDRALKLNPDQRSQAAQFAAELRAYAIPASTPVEGLEDFEPDETDSTL